MPHNRLWRGIILLSAVYTIMFPLFSMLLGNIASQALNYISKIVIFLGMPLTLTLPLYVGYPLVQAYMQRKRRSLSCFQEAVLAWSIGILIIMSIEIAYYTVMWLIAGWIFSPFLYSVIIYILAVIGSLIAIKNALSNGLISQCTSVIWYPAAAVAYSLLVATVISMFWRFPYANENDYIRHAFYSYVLANGRPLIFYYPYLPTLHTILALPLIFAGLTSSTKYFLYIYWAYRFIMYPVFAIAVYALAKKVINKYSIALMASVLATSSVYSYEGSILPWHTAPKNLITIIYTAILAYILGSAGKERLNLKDLTGQILYVAIAAFILLETRDSGLIGYEIGILYPILSVIAILSIYLLERSSWTLLPLFLTALSVHKMEGLVVIAFIILYLVLTNIFNQKIHKILIIITIMLLVYFLLLATGIVTYPPRPYLAPPGTVPFLYSFNKRIYFITNQLYIAPEIILLAAGLAYIALFRSVNNCLEALLILVLLSFLLALLPVNLAYRFLQFGYSLATTVIAYTIFILGKRRKGLMFLLILGVILSLYIHDYHELTHPRIIELQEKRAVFKYCKSLATHFRNSTFDDSIVFGYSFGLGWYQAISSYCAGFFTVNLWHKGVFQENILRYVYCNATSYGAYKTIETLLSRPQYVVNYPDKNGYEFKRWYKRPKNIIILYDEVLAEWLCRNIYSVYKFEDPRYYTVVDVIKSDHKQYYIFKVRNKINMNMKKVLICHDNCTHLITVQPNESCNSIDNYLVCDSHKIKNIIIGPIKLLNGTYILKIILKGKGAIFLSVVLQDENEGSRSLCGHRVYLQSNAIEENCIVNITGSKKMYVQLRPLSREQRLEILVKSLYAIKLK